MPSWFRSKKQQCSGADARFLILLCLGREPYMDAECDIYSEMTLFGACRRILGSRSFTQTLFDPFTLGKTTMQFALSDDQASLVKTGLARHFPVEGTFTTCWPQCLHAAMQSRRFQKAFLSVHSGDKFTFLEQHLQGIAAHTDAPHFIGAVHQTSGAHIRGVAYQLGQEKPLEVDFYLNGKLAGTTTAHHINREIAAHQGTNGEVSFEHTLSLNDNSEVSDDAVLHIFDATSGTLICPPSEICLSPRRSAALMARLTSEIDALSAADADNPETHALLAKISERLPALDQLAAFRLSDYDLYRRTYQTGAPQHTAAGNISIAIIITGADAAKRAVTQASIEAQSYPAAAILDDADRDINAHDFLVTIPAGDMLDRHALAWFAHAAIQNPAAIIIRASSDQLLDGGIYDDPDFIWQFDPLLLKQNLNYARVYAVKISALKTTAHDAPALWQDVFDAHGLAAFASIEPVIWTRGNDDTLPLLPLAIAAPVDGKKLAIIIPTKDALSLVKPCVESVIKTLAAPKGVEIIIVDNNSTEADTLAWLTAIEGENKRGVYVRVVRDSQPFNWASINNKAAATTDADYLLFLNNDTLAKTHGWDNILRGLLEIDGIGAVGAKLLYSDNTIQHAGVVLDGNSLAVHEGAGASDSSSGYQHRHCLTHACAAVTGAFLACRRTDFTAAGGFDAENFAVTFNDIDFCLRMNAAGLQTVYTPLITFYHLESKSRGYDGGSPEKAARAKSEHRTLRDKWKINAAIDPWYPNVFDHAGSKPFSTLRRPSRQHKA